MAAAGGSTWVFACAHCQGMFDFGVHAAVLHCQLQVRRHCSPAALAPCRCASASGTATAAARSCLGCRSRSTRSWSGRRRRSPCWTSCTGGAAGDRVCAGGKAARAELVHGQVESMLPGKAAQARLLGRQLGSMRPTQAAQARLLGRQLGSMFPAGNAQVQVGGEHMCCLGCASGSLLAAAAAVGNASPQQPVPLTRTTTLAFTRTDLLRTPLPAAACTCR